MLYANYVRNKMRHLYKTAEAEGVPCILKYSKGKYMKDYEIYGNSMQDGTPSPENPVEIQSVGDFTKNLLPYPYISTTKTINGVTFTDNGDGSITVNGTATANAVFYLVDGESNYTLDKCGLKIGDSYTISKILVSGDSIANIYFTANYYDKNGKMQEGAVISNSNTATKTIKSDFKSWGIYLLVLKDKTVNNTTIKLQLEKGSSATEYEPYHKYDIPITVAGKNMFNTFDFINFYTPYWQYPTEYGYHDEVREECLKVYGSINADGRALYYMENKFKENTAYTFSLDCYDVFYSNGMSGITLYFMYTDGIRPSLLDIREDKTWKHFSVTSDPNKTIKGIIVGYSTGAAYSYLKNIQLEENSSATEYETYHEPITTHIYLDEPLRKIGDYSDYVDFKKQKVVRNVKEITFENTVFNEYTYGTEFDNTYHFNIRDMGCVYTSPMLCNIMKAGNISMNTTVNDTFFTSNYSNAANGGIYLQIEKSLIDDYSGESNAEKLKAFLINKNAKLLYCTTGYSEESISLPTLQTFKDTTIMSVDTTVLPSNIKVTYVRT